MWLRSQCSLCLFNPFRLGGTDKKQRASAALISADSHITTDELFCPIICYVKLLIGFDCIAISTIIHDTANNLM